MPIQLLSEDRNPDSNCMVIFENKIPKDPRGIMPLLSQDSASELLLIITDDKSQKITGILSSKFKYHKYSFKFNMINSIPTKTN